MFFSGIISDVELELVIHIFDRVSVEEIWWYIMWIIIIIIVLFKISCNNLVVTFFVHRRSDLIHVFTRVNSDIEFRGIFLGRMTVDIFSCVP